jgi:heme/copper-type cytochrome/quinol oxidase subunit 3
MSEGSDSAPLLMASRFGAGALVEYGANLVSNFGPAASCFLEQSFYRYFGVHRLRLIKSLMPLLVSPVRKRVRVTPGFKAKQNFHSMCAQESSLHTYHIENR